MIILEGKPISTNSIYRRGRGKTLYMREEAKDLKENYQWQIKNQWKEKPTAENIELVVRLYFDNKRTHDIDNYNKLLLDSMKGIVFEDDSQIQRLTIEKSYDKGRPRIEVEVFKFEGV